MRVKDVHVRGQRRDDSRARRSQRTARFSVLLAALIMVIGTAGQALLFSAVARADGRPPGGNLSDPAVRAINITTPAAVRIGTIYLGHITLNLTHCGQRVTLPTSGQGYATGGLGSGALISANGDILTADHVVNIPREALDQEIFQSETSASEIAAVLNACYTGLSFPITPADVANGIIGGLGITFSTQYSAPQVLVWRDTAWSGELAGKARAGDDILAGLMAAPYSRARVVASSDFMQDDLAIIHVGLSDTPSIQLDPSADVAVEDPLAIIGFPGNGDFSSDPTDLLTVSVNNATVSAIKKNDNGSALIQIGGNVEHGDSGGPALNAAGHIVGVVSFGGTETPGITAFLRSSDSAQALISHAGINTTPGPFQRAWEQAFGEYAATTAGHWHRATHALQDLHTKYPEFQGMLPYLRYAERQASQESSLSLPPAVASLPPLVLFGGVGVVLALLIVGAILLAVRARRRAAQRAARIPQPAMAMVPAGAYAPPAQPGSYGYQGYPPLPYPPVPAGAAAPYGPAPSGPVPPPSAMPSGPSGPWSGPRAPLMPGAPGAATPPAARGRPSGGMSDMCLNGHLLPSGVVTCGICGAPRRGGA